MGYGVAPFLTLGVGGVFRVTSHECMSVTHCLKRFTLCGTFKLFRQTFGTNFHVPTAFDVGFKKSTSPMCPSDMGVSFVKGTQVFWWVLEGSQKESRLFGLGGPIHKKTHPYHLKATVRSIPYTIWVLIQGRSFWIAFEQDGLDLGSMLTFLNFTPEG